MESEFAIDLLLLDYRLLQLIEPLVDKVHLVVGKIFSDEKGELLQSGHSILQSCVDSKCIEAAAKFRVLLESLTDHQLLLAISKLSIDFFKLIPPLKMNYDIGPAGAILLRYLSDRINKDSIVLICLH